MAEGIASGAHERDIWKGRLALALVSARAEKCPDRRCARRRHCLAAIGQSFNFHRPKGDCPIMTEAEWRAVSLGMRRNLKRMEPWVRAREGASRSEAETPPKLEREHASAARQIEADSRRPRSYSAWLWAEAVADRFAYPRDIAALERQLIATLSAEGCRCAKERQIGDCPAC